jgi:hypothetical protein
MPPLTRWVGVPGTWGTHRDEGRWWVADSPLAEHLRTLGAIPLRQEPFHWSTDLNGFFGSLFQRRQATHSDWLAGGAALTYYLRHTRVEDRNIIAHSHGLQVVLYACGFYGLKINTLVSVSGPVRADMREVTLKARQNIGYWTHVHTPGDRTQWLGEWFDGVIGKVQKHPYADLNVGTPGAGHSDLFHDPARYIDWSGLIAPAFVKQAPGKFPYGQ